MRVKRTPLSFESCVLLSHINALQPVQDHEPKGVAQATRESFEVTAPIAVILRWCTLKP